MYETLCEIPADIDPGELARRVRAFNDDFRAIPLTVTLHGLRFSLPIWMWRSRRRQPSTRSALPPTRPRSGRDKLGARTRLEPLAPDHHVFGRAKLNRCPPDLPIAERLAACVIRRQGVPEFSA